MNKKIFIIDNDNKKVKWLSTSLYRMALFPIIDTVVLLLIIPTILFLLNELKVVNLYLGGTFLITYIYIVIAYIVISMAIAIFDLFKYISLNNTMVVKENDNITIVKGLNKTRGATSATDVMAGSIFYNNSDSLLGMLASLGLYAHGTVELQKKLTEKDINKIELINKILDERSNSYKYTDYKNCRLLTETDKYYEYTGEKNGVSTKFKIYKVYSNINLLNKEGN